MEAAEALMPLLATLPRGDSPIPVVGAVAWPPLVQRLGARMVGVQPWRAAARALAAAGVTVRPEQDERGVALAIALPEGQRDAARAQVGRAAAALGEGGVLIVSTPNDRGAGWLERQVRAACGAVEVEARRHCRVLRISDPAALVAWSELDAPRPVLDGALWSRPGLFSWDEIDPGSALLARSLEARVGGVVGDAGAGWGWLASQLVGRVDALELLEADARALALARRNLASSPVPVGAWWCDVRDERPVEGLDAVVTNPPFHEAGRTDPAVGVAFLGGAWRMLRRGGELWLVANGRLPYEEPLRAMGAKLRRVVEARGYKVLVATRPG